MQALASLLLMALSQALQSGLSAGKLGLYWHFGVVFVVVVVVVQSGLSAEMLGLYWHGGKHWALFAGMLWL